MKNKKIFLILAVVLFSGAFLIILFNVVKKSAEKNTSSDNSKVKICNHSDIEKYNAFYGVESEDIKNLKEIREDIIKRKDYSSDINCLIMSYNIADLVEDEDSKTAEAKKIRELNEKGNSYVDLRIRGISSIYNIELDAKRNEEVGNAVPYNG